MLLTGFEPWGREQRNPSGEVALALGGQVLPVDYAAAARAIKGFLRRRPDAILMLGLAPGRTSIALEALAVNVDHCEERGAQWRWRRPIGKGPLVLPTRLPLDPIYRRLSRARIPVRVSHHAGTFICNHVFYVALAASKVPCGFVHLPPFKAIPAAQQIRAVELILETLGRSRTSTRSAPRRAPSRRGSKG